jgi:hypothetical protein
LFLGLFIIVHISEKMNQGEALVARARVPTKTTLSEPHTPPTDNTTKEKINILDEEFFDYLKRCYELNPLQFGVYHVLRDLGKVFFDHPSLEKFYNALLPRRKKDEDKEPRYMIQLGTLNTFEEIDANMTFEESLLKFFQKSAHPHMHESLAASLKNPKLVHIVILGTTRVLYKIGKKRSFASETVIVAASTVAMLDRFTLLLWLCVKGGKTDALWGCESSQSQFAFRRSYLGTLLLITVQNIGWYLKGYSKIVTSVSNSDNCGAKLFFCRNCFRLCKRMEISVIIKEIKELQSFINLNRNDHLMQTYDKLDQLNEVMFIYSLANMEENLLPDIIGLGKRFFWIMLILTNT